MFTKQVKKKNRLKCDDKTGGLSHRDHKADVEGNAPCRKSHAEGM